MQLSGYYFSSVQKIVVVSIKISWILLSVFSFFSVLNIIVRSQLEFHYAFEWMKRIILLILQFKCKIWTCLMADGKACYIDWFEFIQSQVSSASHIYKTSKCAGWIVYDFVSIQDFECDMEWEERGKTKSAGKWVISKYFIWTANAKWQMVFFCFVFFFFCCESSNITKKGRNVSHFTSIFTILFMWKCFPFFFLR